MLLEKAESGDNRSLKDIWAAYRKKEVQVEVKMNTGMSDPELETETISEEAEKPSGNIRKSSTEIEKIGDRIVKVQFVEYIGKRKKKVTHIEVKEADTRRYAQKSRWGPFTRSTHFFEKQSD